MTPSEMTGHILIFRHAQSREGSLLSMRHDTGYTRGAIVMHPHDAQDVDVAFMADMGAYVRNEGAAADGRHERVQNLCWWSWSPNSWDTGGIMANDWRTVSPCCQRSSCLPHSGIAARVSPACPVSFRQGDPTVVTPSTSAQSNVTLPSVWLCTAELTLLTALLLTPVWREACGESVRL